MYANLRVTPLAGAEVRPDAIARRHVVDGEPLMAYEVTVGADGRVSVALDGQDGRGSYYEHAGRVAISGPVRIQADF